MFVLCGDLGWLPKPGEYEDPSLPLFANSDIVAPGALCRRVRTVQCYLRSAASQLTFLADFGSTMSKCRWLGLKICVRR